MMTERRKRKLELKEPESEKVVAQTNPYTGAPYSKHYFHILEKRKGQKQADFFDGCDRTSDMERQRRLYQNAQFTSNDDPCRRNGIWKNNANSSVYL